MGSVRHAVAYCNLFNALIRCACVCVHENSNVWRICKQNNRRYCDGEFLDDLRRVFVYERGLVRHNSHHLKWNICNIIEFSYMLYLHIWVIAKLDNDIEN